MRDVQRRFRSITTLALVTVGALCATTMAACNKTGGGKKSPAAHWVDEPSSGTKDGTKITIPNLGVAFQVPDTLYVYRDCGEASHTPEGAQGWIPVITCRTTSGEFGGFGDDEAEEDPFAEEDYAEATGAEAIDLTVFVTHKTRPLDERSVAWFENQYKQAGLDVDEISYQHDYQKKSGIYAKLHIPDQETGTPTREIIQFMFPRDDVVFIARMEYPFGESRSVEADWKYILWNFEIGGGGDDEGE